MQKILNILFNEGELFFGGAFFVAARRFLQHNSLLYIFPLKKSIGKMYKFFPIFLYILPIEEHLAM